MYNCVYIYIYIWGRPNKPHSGKNVFRQGVSAVFRGSVSGQGWKCFGTVFQQFREHIWEDVSGMCFGAVFRDVFRDADTRPQNTPFGPKLPQVTRFHLKRHLKRTHFRAPPFFSFCWAVAGFTYRSGRVVPGGAEELLRRRPRMS